MSRYELSIHAHTHMHECTQSAYMCAHKAHFVSNSNITISIDAIVDGEFQQLPPNNPSWPIIASILFPQRHPSENVSNALGNNPKPQHTEKREVSFGLAGFGLPGVAPNACVVSDSVSRHFGEGSVIGNCCPSKKSALFNKQCPLKKFKIYQKRNVASPVTIRVLALAEIDLRFQPPFSSYSSFNHSVSQLSRCKIFKIQHASHQSNGQNFVR